MSINPGIGSQVVTSDDEELGHVKRVEEVAFLVDVTGAPDYWLKRDEIEDAEAEQVRMTFEAVELEDHWIQYGE